VAKNDLEDYQGAIADFSKAIEIDPTSADEYIIAEVPKVI